MCKPRRWPDKHYTDEDIVIGYVENYDIVYDPVRQECFQCLMPGSHVKGDQNPVNPKDYSPEIQAAYAFQKLKGL